MTSTLSPTIVGRLAYGLFCACFLAACSGTPIKMAELQPIPNSAVIKKLWSTTLAGESDGTVMVPAVAEQGIYVADTQGVVRRIRTTSVEEKTWRRNLGFPLLGGVAVADGLVVVTGVKGQVVALDARNGVTLWQITRPAETAAPMVVLENLVILKGNDGAVIALNRADGKEVWLYRFTVPPLTVQSFAQMVVIDNSQLIVGLPGGQLVALDVNTGARLWQVEVSPPTGITELERVNDVVGDLAVDKDKHMVCASAFRGRLVCFDLAGGQSLWGRDFSSPVGMAVDDKLLYAVDQRGVVYAFDINSGAPLWKQEGLLNRRPTAPLLFGDHLVVGDAEGYLHLLNIADGQLAGRIRMDVGEINATPQKFAQDVLVLSKYGRLGLYALP